MASMAPIGGMGGGNAMASMAPIGGMGGANAAIGASMAPMAMGGMGSSSAAPPGASGTFAVPPPVELLQMSGSPPANGYPAATMAFLTAGLSSSSSGGLNAQNPGNLPHYARQDAEIQQLTDVYQQQLVELNACHSLLQADQERLSQMLLPYVNASGQLVLEAADPAIIMFKDGLELRLAEFKEDCKRIQQIERRLQAKIDAATAEYEHTVQDVSNVADARILKRLREQQRLIDIQQAEIDEVRHEKNCLQAETQRLRELTKFGNYSEAIPIRKNYSTIGDDDLPRYPSAHLTYHGAVSHSDTSWAKRPDRGPAVIHSDIAPKE